MTAKYIGELTPEQIALIPIIRDEWIKIALDTTPIDKQKAESAICLAYECAEFESPQQILWFDNPLDAINYVASTCGVADDISDDVWDAIGEAVWEAIKEAVGNAVGDVWKVIEDAVRRDTEISTHAAWDIVMEAVMKAVRNTVWDALITTQCVADDFAYFDAMGVDYSYLTEPVRYSVWNALITTQCITCYAYFDAMGFDCSKAKGLFSTAKHCGWWWAFKDVAVAIPKPSAIRLDDRGRLHAEGVPAIAYKGFNVYAYHGVRLPEKYGELHPEQWQSQWLLEEDNAELKRVLIQGIGYDRICQELQAIELDSWQEYTLLRIDSNIDVEPIYLLKMTCPSTGYIHALRVPPDVVTARDAITWVNWGIAPEEFAIQT